MNIIIIAVLIILVSYIFSESGIISKFNLYIDTYFKKDKVGNFLNGIDNAPLSQEEITQFKDYLISSNNSLQEQQVSNN
jgi:hypothetical protein